jgi:branched-chain amino acid aminotransferase
MLQKFDERNKDLIVNVGGKLSHRDRAAISPFDSSVQGGDAVWEGLRLHNGTIFRLETHLARLRASAKALAFEQIPSDEEITEQIKRTLEANGMHDGVHIRLTLTRGEKVTSGMDPRLNTSGPTLIVLAEFKDPVYDAAGVTLITASVRRPAPDCLDPKIHHNNLLPSILAKIEANVAGADDAIVLDNRGFIAETNATHVFFVSGRTLKTPTTVSCPEGITRAAVLELAASAGIATEQGDYTLPQLYNADEAFVTGTMGGLTPVLSVDGRKIPGPGPVTAKLAELYAALTTSEDRRLPDLRCATRPGPLLRHLELSRRRKHTPEDPLTGGCETPGLLLLPLPVREHPGVIHQGLYVHLVAEQRASRCSGLD